MRKKKNPPKKQIEKVFFDIDSLHSEEKTLVIYSLLDLVKKLRWSLMSRHIGEVVIDRSHDINNCAICSQVLWADAVLTILNKD